MTHPNADLLEAVNVLLLPRVGHLGLQIVDHQEGGSFDNATVTLTGLNVRVRVYRERGIVHMEVASTHSPHAWMDSAVVMEYFALSREGGFHGTSLSVVIDGIGSFLNSSWDELNRIFDQASFRETNRALESVRTEQSVRRWGC